MEELQVHGQRLNLTHHTRRLSLTPYACSGTYAHTHGSHSSGLSGRVWPTNPYILRLGTPFMEAREGRLRELLVGNLQFIVPIYQRTYDWGKEHCRQLYDDIVQAGLSGGDPAHFMGAITYYTPKQAIENISHHQLIDGQQRITTFMLLLVALKHELRDQIPQPPTLIDQILYNSIESKDSDKYLKMKLTKEDNGAFEEILKNGHTTRSGSIKINYELFCKWLSQDRASNNFDVIWKGIQKLTVVHIAANDQDNAQRIFESMNSTGLELSTTDLVQNHLLMQGDLDWQKKVYNDYWYPMEELFVDDRDAFDNYLHCYLTMKQSLSITKKQLYKKFKEYAKQHTDKILPDLHQHARHYACLLHPKKHKSSSKKLDKLIERICDQNPEVAHPLLLKIVNDYESKLIGEDTAIELFTLIDSYLLRCTVAGTAKNLNRAIPVIMSKLNENDYANSIRGAVLERRGKDRFPDDLVFKRNFTTKEFYQKDRVTRYILNRLAEEYQSGALNLDDSQIEHIMPQTLSDEWRKTLGDKREEIHNEHLHRIGNLTLTNDNPSLGNNPFGEKQKIYAKSDLKMTTDLHTNYNQWTETEIISRSELLANAAIRIWKCPKGYSTNSRGGNEDIELEQDHLVGTNVATLWSDLKKAILSQSSGVVFEMWQKYANFKVLDSTGKSHPVCSIQALKCKIYVVYNTRLSDGIIRTSDSVDDVSKVGHLGTGDLRLKVYGEDDIPKAVNLVNRVVQQKLSS